ncbi:prolyl oligopeptidase family serine peptidase [Brachybacterium sp. GCM10030267]|uniref:prolyl oligopeptidase family serine peptidase n=1 Tax=Brachybacterium sp. GCM10030267 TaxID=3273381 RepID=UPI003614BE5A
MTAPLPRRTLLTAGSAGTAAALAALAPTASAQGRSGEAPARPGGPPARTARFTLQAQVLDGGQQVTSVVIDAGRRGGLIPGELSPEAFSVHATGTNPVTGTVAFDVDRTVTAARADHSGRISLDLEHGPDVEGAGTLEYLDDASRNVLLELEYTLTQNAPLPAHGNGHGSIDEFVQDGLVDAEVDAFSSHVAASGTNYRLFTPHGHGSARELSLVVWLHGGGEGGLFDGEIEYYDNETHLRANRGALAFATDEAQEIFGGAIVVAPQCTSAWMDDGPAFEPLIDEIIEEVAADHPVDRDRVHVIGCSNGGYMSLKMVVENPGAFASTVPICGVVQARGDSPGRLVTDDELAAIDTPTWLIAAADDTTVDPQANTVHAHGLIPDSIMSLYDDVTWEGESYPGHFSWIYAARNDPSHQGTHLWEWMAAQRR